MKLIGSPSLVFLILSLAATLLLNFSSPLFLFSLFNTIILALVLGNYRPPCAEEVDGGTWSSCEDGELVAYNNKVENNYDDNDYEDGSKYFSSDDDDEDDRSKLFSSNGYDEDDDESGSDGEIGWEDDEIEVDKNEVVDDSLRRRVEDFIDMVNKGWREEWLMDNLDSDYED